MLTPSQKELLHLLKQHQSLDGDEARNLKFAITYAELEPVWFDRRTVPAHFTASAVIWDPVEKKLLLEWDPQLPGFVMVGAHDDGQHDLPGTALREAIRMSGLPLSHVKPLHIMDLALIDVPAHGEEKAHRHIDLRFLMLADSHLPLKEISASYLRWFTLDAAVKELDEEGADRLVARLRMGDTGFPAA